MARRLRQPKRCHPAFIGPKPGCFCINWRPTRSEGSRHDCGSLENHRHVMANQFAPFACGETQQIDINKRIRSAVTRQLSLFTPQIAFAIKLLPEPDSPTRPRISPSVIPVLTRSTAFNPLITGFKFNGSGYEYRVMALFHPRQ